MSFPRTRDMTRLRCSGVSVSGTPRLSPALADHPGGCKPQGLTERRLSATHQRILDLLVERVGQDVPGREIAAVTGIWEWARRVRELRVEHGYNITLVRAGKNSLYRLESVEPDLEAARRWRLMNRIRRDPEHGARDRILAYLRENVGQPVSMDDLRYVANVHEVGRRVRELRTEHGYVITTNVDRTDLRPGEYVLETLEPLPANERLLAEQRTRILEARRLPLPAVRVGRGRPADTRETVRRSSPQGAGPREGGGSEDDNLETLCNACHDAIPM